MTENSDKNLVVIAPTGSGKTEAALLWLNGEKGFYTLPLKVSSNAIYKRIKEKYFYDKVEILHSDSMQKYVEESRESESTMLERYEKAKLLSNPLTVCTVDQLFKFVYKALGTEIFAATLKYSKLILDEIQAYSPRIIATIIFGLKQITEMGGKFAIVTATFPPVLQHFMEMYGLAENRDYLFHDFSETTDSLRHMVEIRKSEINIQEIAERGRTQKVLVICNTVKKAQKVYESLTKQTDEVYLLHSKYIREHRNQLEEKMIHFSEDKCSFGIWVTTQIVEASLDIDFDILYTEMCTADSLLQRMGRCNRKGRYLPTEANIIVFDDRVGVGKRAVYDAALYDRSLEKLKEYEGHLFSEKQKIEYINWVYKTEDIQELDYYKDIQDWLEHFKNLPPLEYNKQEANEKFRDINSITVMPENIYEQNRDLIESCAQYLQDSSVSREVKNVFRSKMNSLTMSLSFPGKIPEGIDRVTMQLEKSDHLKIHRTRMGYEFDVFESKGRGLLMEQLEDEIFV